MTEMIHSRNLKLKHIVVGRIAPHAISIPLLVVAIVVYTFVLSFQAPGESIDSSLESFTVLVSTVIVPALTILLTVLAAAWVVRRVDSSAAIVHGLLSRRGSRGYRPGIRTARPDNACTVLACDRGRLARC